MNTQHNALTMRADGRARAVESQVEISLPSDTPEEAIKKNIQLKKYKGIWDTGASNSVITKKIIDEIGLKPIGVVEVYHAHGKTNANKYLIDMRLPSNVIIPTLAVTEGVLNGMDILIGMDVITLGDFVITNKNGKTVMSFRVPSCAEIDFVPESNEYNHVMKNGNKKIKKLFLEKYK